jgi:hypothetical protein
VRTRGLFSLLVLLTGVLIGRFLIPWVEIKQESVIHIPASSDQRICKFDISVTKHRFGRWIGLASGGDTLRCNESTEALPEVFVFCKCR